MGAGAVGGDDRAEARSSCGLGVQMEMENSSVTTAAAEPIAAPPAPRRGRLLAANSLVVMGISIFWISAAIALLDFTLVLLGLFAAVVLSSEYGACVWRNVGAARRLAALHTFGLIFSGVYMIVLTSADMWYGTTRGASLELTILAVMGVSAALGRHGYRRWSRECDDWLACKVHEDSVEGKKPFQFFIRDLLALMTIVALIAGIAAWMIRSDF
jgi:uncharacterized membrane protein YgdD (TMEM256/DUF423 family)